MATFFIFHIIAISRASVKPKDHPAQASRWEIFARSFRKPYSVTTSGSSSGIATGVSGTGTRSTHGCDGLPGFGFGLLGSGLMGGFSLDIGSHLVLGSSADCGCCDIEVGAASEILRWYSRTPMNTPATAAIKDRAAIISIKKFVL